MWYWGYFFSSELKEFFKPYKNINIEDIILGFTKRGESKLGNMINDFFTVELGFKGKLLKDMQSLVKTEKDLEDFKNFIIINDGRFRTNLQLVYLYTMHLQEQGTSSKEEFVNEYKEGNRKEALESVIKTSANTVLLNKVEKVLENGLTLENLYDKLIEYQMYNPIQAIRLIALHNDSLKKIS